MAIRYRSISAPSDKTVDGLRKWVEEELNTISRALENDTPSYGGLEPFPVVDDWAPTASGADADYSRFQAALDEIGAAGGGNLYMLPRSYSCSFAPQIPKGVHLQGAGPGRCKIVATGTDTSILRTKDANGLYGVSDILVRDVLLQGTSAQLYGFLGRGVDGGTFERITVTGLSASTGSGWDGSEAAWGFYFTAFDDSGAVRRKSNNNVWMDLTTLDSPNSFANASYDGGTTGAGGNNNILFGAYFTGFTGIGIDAWGESCQYYSPRVNSSNNNITCIRVHDAKTLLVSPDADSTNGTNIGEQGPGPWGFPLGIRSNNNTGLYFYDTASGVVINTTGNGCSKRVDFESATAFAKVDFIGAQQSHIVQPIGGVPSILNTYTADHTLTMADAGQVVRMNVTTTANNVTVPANATVPFLIGTEIEIIQYGTGVTTIVAAGGVTIQKKSGLTISGTRFGTARIRKILDNVWVASGDLT